MSSLFIISAPSGCGKTSLIKSILADVENLSLSISHTTRKPRKSEINNKDYYFISIEEFEDMIAKDEFIEYAKVFGNYYGTSKKTIAEIFAQNKDAILEIDWQGARSIKKNTNAQSIFILPPSKQALLERLTTRAQDSEEVIAKRMSEARKEISHFKEFDFIVFNDDFKKAYKEIKNIILADRLKLKKQQNINKDLINKLIK